MDEKQAHLLFKKRWERFRKLGLIKYSLFLAILYSGTILFTSIIFDYIKGKQAISEIFTFIDQTLLIKTLVFFTLGLIFGIYHYKKSEKKYNS